MRKLAFALTLALLAGAFMPGAAFAAKSDDWNELASLGNQLSALKGQTNDPAAAQQFNQLLDRYRALSAGLGGDDPAGLLGNRGTARQGAAINVAPPAPPNTTATTATFTNNTPLPIPDFPTPAVSSTIAVATTDTVLWDLDLTINLPHTFNGDLDITLTSPSATTVVISTDNGGSNNDVFSGSTFDDSAVNITTDFVYVDGSPATLLIPEGAMAVFVGEDPNGNWTITIGDDAGIDTGTLNSWSLDVTTLDQAPAIDPVASAANNTPLAIPDFPAPAVSSTVNVATPGTSICDINLTIDLTHTFAGDLDITLTSPSGTITVITTDNGGSNDNVFSSSTFDDDAAATVTDFVYVDGSPASPLVPEGAMGAFGGEDPNGTWTITIGDDAGIDTGTLNSWSVDVVTCSGTVVIGPGQPIVEIPTLGTFGLLALFAALAGVGFVLLRRRAA